MTEPVDYPPIVPCSHEEWFSVTYTCTGWTLTVCTLCDISWSSPTEPKDMNA